MGAGCIALIAVLGGWNVLASNVLHGDVTPRTLFVSVEKESGGGSLVLPARHRVCHPKGRGSVAWSCEVDDPHASAGASTYSVNVHGSCWHASGGSGGLPRTVSGCVHLHED